MICHELQPKIVFNFWGVVQVTTQSWVLFIFVVQLANINILFYIC